MKSLIYVPAKATIYLSQPVYNKHWIGNRLFINRRLFIRRFHRRCSFLWSGWWYKRRFSPSPWPPDKSAPIPRHAFSNPKNPRKNIDAVEKDYGIHNYHQQ